MQLDGQAGRRNIPVLASRVKASSVSLWPVMAMTKTKIAAAVDDGGRMKNRRSWVLLGLCLEVLRA